MGSRSRSTRPSPAREAEVADVVVDVDMVVGSEVEEEETQVMAAMAPVTGAPVAMEVVEVEVTEEDVEEEEATETAGTGSVEMVDMAEEAPMEVREVMEVDRVATEVAREAMEEQEISRLWRILSAAAEQDQESSQLTNIVLKSNLLSQQLQLQF